MIILEWRTKVTQIRIYWREQSEGITRGVDQRDGRRLVLLTERFRSGWLGKRSVRMRHVDIERWVVIESNRPVCGVRESAEALEGIGGGALES